MASPQQGAELDGRRWEDQQVAEADMGLGRSDSKVLPLVCPTSLPARHRAVSEQCHWEDSSKSNKGVQPRTGGGLD